MNVSSASNNPAANSAATKSGTESKPANFLKRHDALKGLVIGAGLAGLAFSELIRRNYPLIDLKIIEQRGRTGGCVYTKRDNPGQDGVDLGAENVNEDHHTVKRWAKALDVSLLNIYPDNQIAPSMSFLSGNTYREDFWSALKQLVEIVIIDRERIKTDAELRKVLDKTSVESYVKNLGLSSDDAELLFLFLETEQGVKPRRMSVTFLLDFMDFENLKQEYGSFFAPGDDKYVIQGGSSSLVSAIEAKLHNHIELGRMVEGINSTSTGGFRVYVGKAKAIEADFLILAIPGPAFGSINVYNNVAGLGELKEKLRKLEYSDIEKTVIEVDGPPLPILTEFNQVLVEEAKGLVWWSGRWRGSDKQTSHISVYRGGSYVGYVPPGTNATKADVHLVKSLAKASNSITNTNVPVPKVRNAFIARWSDGGFSQPRLGKGADFRRGVQVRWGNVFIVGEHMAKSDPQTMEGALQSAEQGFVEFEHFMRETGGVRRSKNS